MKMLENHEKVLNDNWNRFIERIINGTHNLLESPFRKKDSKKSKQKQPDKKS